ncbi:hypothetical protein M972_112445 [Acetivibrio thermocellus AD2]|jgi:hypothetical protein|uniref:Uncharacterized protein n=1 Tax=Acetivibrio thermocellus AD2 TaxID=1138384 RepID=A0AB36TIH9_ACETH|nr:hypothetical protein [Acetivibrio thermocellus]ADU75362.1 hypothetical protein Clo1313_2340 [Acetivibrio thermocellus DSM 1313]ALX09356.1 hypothetical protein AD2_02370 [Acetivibrio thermocellus AD2]ANV77110.1 hypothetical protein LQRI_2369 [Acetivibrio thermocellus DSM 2360]EIC04683.1 hypothetical protein YSBL_1657 [Acetivibrio thermocellus YS]PFH03633.1 hypothetical protein M972_112445 [Acetivibrio thermocellus AD2]
MMNDGKEKKNESNAESGSDYERIDDMFFRQINERRKEDPLIGAKLGAKEIFNTLLNAVRDSRGVHIETLICALGALAGYSCQASLRKEFVEIRGLSEEQVFTVIQAKNGKRYFFGDLINKPLFENQYSVWSLAAGIVQHMGVNIDFDILEIFKYVSATVGTENYGIPRIPEGHRTADVPINFVKAFWPLFLPRIEKYCASPREWPVLFGLAIQDGLLQGKDVIDPSLALKIVMESAIPMAKAEIVFD